MTGPRKEHRQQPSRRVKDLEEVNADIASKGPISLLQEFIQCSRDFPSPPNQPILQWSFDTRMADLTTLEFRGIVAFLLDGVPHHVAGTWQRAKKLAQRDAAERALSFFVDSWGEHLLSQGKGRALPTSRGVRLTDSLEKLEFAVRCYPIDNEVALLEHFCQNYPCTGGAPPAWTLTMENSGYVASVQVQVLGVPHHFEGSPCSSEDAAKIDTAQKVLWYLHCPGYESIFEVDPKALASKVKEGGSPPAYWASPSDDKDKLQIAEQKTVLMRTQNRLQQVFAKHLKPGQKVWEWSYESDLHEPGLTPDCRAMVRLLTGDEFIGDWAPGQRQAQIDVCQRINAYLDECCPASQSCPTSRSQAPDAFLLSV